MRAVSVVALACMLSALGGADAQTAGVQSAGEVRRAAEVLVFGCVSAVLLYM